MFQKFDSLRSKHPEKDNWDEVDLITDVTPDEVEVSLAASKQKRGCGEKIMIPITVLNEMVRIGSYRHVKG